HVRVLAGPDHELRGLDASGHAGMVSTSHGRAGTATIPPMSVRRLVLPDPPAFSGNKLRNLEFLLGAARAEGADTVVTVGRRWSNHCRLTAAAGSMLGLAVHIVISGPALPS